MRSKSLREAGSGAQLVTLSNNASSGFIKLLGDNARGVIVSQVLPQSPNYALVQEAAGLAESQRSARCEPGDAGGLCSAKVLVEALRRAGPQTHARQTPIRTRSISRFDLGVGRRFQCH